MIPTRLTVLFAALLAASVLMAGALGKRLYDQSRQHSAVVADLQRDVKRAQEARKRSDAALVSLRQKNASTARLGASARASLQAATASSPGWAAEPLPKEVQDALRMP